MSNRRRRRLSCFNLVHLADDAMRYNAPNSMDLISLCRTPHSQVCAKWNEKKASNMSKSFYCDKRFFLKCQIEATCVHSQESFQLSGLLSRGGKCIQDLHVIHALSLLQVQGRTVELINPNYVCCLCSCKSLYFIPTNMLLIVY